MDTRLKRKKMRTQDWESKKITKNVSFLKIKEGRILCWKAQIYGQWKRFDSPKMMEWLEHILVLNALFPWMLTEVAGEKNFRWGLWSVNEKREEAENGVWSEQDCGLVDSWTLVMAAFIWSLKNGRYYQ